MTHRIAAIGGAGYIGSHVVAELCAAGHSVVILDNFENAPEDICERIARTGVAAPEVIRGDCRDPDALDALFGRPGGIDAVIHFAGRKSVSESVTLPLLYYDLNVVGALRVLEAMQRHGVRRFVFSSSATVYSNASTPPIAERASTHPVSPYGRTKFFVEQILDDLVRADPIMGAISLRYFNPVGAHSSGHLGEITSGEPANLFPYVTQTIVGIRPHVRVFGRDYDTPDGTGVRDYIHVGDLATGHLGAIEALFADDASGRHETINLGTGRGHSVLEVISAFERVSGGPVSRLMLPRRAGDVAELVADPSHAAARLGWRARIELDEMCRDHLASERRHLEN